MQHDMCIVCCELLFKHWYIPRPSAGSCPDDKCNKISSSLARNRIVNTQMQHAVPATPTTIHMIGMRNVRQHSRLVNSSQIGLYSVTVNAQNRLLLQIMSSHKFNEQAFETHSSHTLTHSHARRHDCTQQMHIWTWKIHCCSWRTYVPSLLLICRCTCIRVDFTLLATRRTLYLNKMIRFRIEHTRICPCVFICQTSSVSIEFSAAAKGKMTNHT